MAEKKILEITNNWDDYKLINHLLILARQAFFSLNTKKLLPSLSLLKKRFQSIFEIEKVLANNKNKLLVHLAK